jgi:hypothetical protein
VILSRGSVRRARCELAGELGELGPRVLEPVVHFVARVGEDLLRLGLGRHDELALLALALGLGTLVNRLDLGFDRESALDVAAMRSASRALFRFLGRRLIAALRSANASSPGAAKYTSTPMNNTMFAS